jgi:hypothetical protein
MIKINARRALFTFLTTTSTLISTATYATLDTDQPTASYLNFPSPLSPNTPHDVDQQLQKKLTDAQQFDEVQRLFEILSWQNFIALNWPRDNKGEPQGIDSAGDPIWVKWKESYEVYLPNGAKPAPWGVQTYPPHFKQKNPEKARILFRASKASAQDADIDDEVDQAFTAPIWDQNGNMVRYEILMNESEFDYVVNNELYNIDGQIAFSTAKKTVAFPSASRDKTGAIELKLAWKVIDKSKDIPQRFITQQAYVLTIDPNNGNQFYKKELVGLVGMHISLKTQSSPQWIWATFEQVDNLEANPLIKVDGKKLAPLFYDPNCAICPINRSPNTIGDYSSDTKHQKNQIQRVLPISAATQQLNQQVQALLAKQNTTMQYYQLIGSQWPTDPSAKPYPVADHSAANPPQLPDAVTNKSGGKPTPTYLTNMIMETYFQGSTNGGTDVTQFNTTIANATAWHQIDQFQKYGNVNYLIFGTEGCMGCHYSASIATGKTMVNGKPVATYGPSASADFSWLLTQKAQFKTAKKPH